MKKSVLSLIMVFAMVAVLPVGAQVKFGVKAGVNLSQMSMGKDVFNTSNRAGFFMGPTLKVGLPVLGLGLDMSALYNRQEAKVEGVNPKFNTVLKQQQLIVPVNVKYGIGVGSIANVFVFAGPQIAFNIGDKVKRISEFQDQAAQWTLQSSNFSVNAGLGMTVATHFQVTANYNVGVGKTGDITWENVKENAVSRKTQGSSWCVGLAYFF